MHKIRQVIERLALYGLVVVHDAAEPPSDHHVASRSNFDASQNYYTLDYALLQAMAENQLLGNQRQAIVDAIHDEAPAAPGSSPRGRVRSGSTS